MKPVDHHSAWKDFWANQRPEGGGCLPQAWQGIDAVQRTAWQEIARVLPRNARVLDLATGDGRVLAAMGAVRNDLKLQGIDLAPKLPAAPRGVAIKGGVAMEMLPFPDRAFDAVTSQFGYEYGDAGKIALEIARVLKPASRAALICHRGDGPILAHNLARRDAIRWAIEEMELVAKAKRSLSLRVLGATMIPPVFAQAPHDGARQFGQGSAAWEIAEAVRQTLVLGARDHPASVAQLLDKIAEQARNEMGRIASLQTACATADDTNTLGHAFAEAGLKVERKIALSEAGKAPFADLRILTN